MTGNPIVSLALAANDLLLFPPEGVTPEALRARLSAAGWQGRVVVDARRKCLRALPIDYLAICAALHKHHTIKKSFDLRPPLPHPIEVKLQARPYQTEAIEAWQAASNRGVVVLPTGAGKT